MVDDSLKDSLAKTMEFGLVHGLSRKELYGTLTGAGWPADLVNAYFEKVQADMGPSALLQVNAVSKRFGSMIVIDKITIDVRPGEILGIIGLSGCGKTTLLRMIAGFLSPDTGDVSLSVENKTYSVFKHPEQAKRLVGFSTQVPSFYDKLSVRENLEHFAALYTLADIPTRVSTVLRQVGLAAQQSQYAGELSGGQQKILDIACAIIHKPRVLILDEPTANIDPVSVKKIFGLVEEINRTGTTVILATHLLAGLDRFCNRVAILRNGRITECATPDELKKVFSRNYEIQVETESGVTDQLVAELRKYSQLFPKIISTKPLIVSTPAPKRALRFVAGLLSKSQETVKCLSLSRPSLNEIFDLLNKK